MATAAGKDICELEGKNILEALVGLIQPLIHAYSLVGSGNSNGNSEVDVQIDEQEKRLLLALKDFVKATLKMEKGLKESNKTVKASSQSSSLEPLTAQIGKPSPRELTLVPSLSPPGKGLHDSLMNALRDRVFNVMPIRMLHFDPTGSQIRLIDRNEVINLLFPKVYTKALPHSRLYEQGGLASILVKMHAKYAILSHTWIRGTPGDVVFGDWDNRMENERGHTKIAKFCEVASRFHGLSLGWMDTVCINKESSSELDESIRSMYKWYQQADICIAFMSETDSIKLMYKDSWFTRGWTLQELLAPQQISFYDRNWVPMMYTDPLPFNTAEADIESQILVATKMTPKEISNFRRQKPDLIPISRRFQLAAGRTVTRSEDKAYSLMGLMGVDISVAYGEGAERALYRLQKEILSSKRSPLDMFNCSSSNSKSIFPSSLYDYYERTDEFDCHNDEVASTLDLWTPSEPLLCTHLGVRLQVLLIPGLQLYSYENTWSPKGYFFGETEVSIFSKTRYALLHQRIYMDKLTMPPPDSSLPLIVHFATLNFNINLGYVELPEVCLAVPLDCGNARAGTITQPDVTGICRIHQVVTFHIESFARGAGLTTYDLETHGMQLATLYL